MTQPYPQTKAVVIVEDTNAVAELIRDTLNAEPGFRGVVVHDGGEALDVIHAIELSVILLDVGLPGMSGLTLYDKLRAEERTRDVPIIFVTAGYDNPGLQSRGITNVIPKPFNIDDLLYRVQMACSGVEPCPPTQTVQQGELVIDGSKHDLHDITYFLTSAG